MLRSVIVFAILALLGGCASLKEKSGFVPHETTSAQHKRVEPYQAMAIRADTLTDGISMATIELNSALERELDLFSKDEARPYDAEEVIVLGYRISDGEAVFHRVLYRGKPLTPKQRFFLVNNQTAVAVLEPAAEDHSQWRGVSVVALPPEVHGRFASRDGGTVPEFRLAYQRKILREHARRNVFRAIPYDSDNRAIEGLIFDAYIAPNKRELVLLVPFAHTDKVRGKNVIVVSPGGDFMITLRAEKVTIAKGEMLGVLPADFFEKHPSQLDDLVSIQHWSKIGRLTYAAIEQTFPYSFRVGQRAYRGHPDTRIVLEEYTPLNDWQDKVLSCTSFTIDTMSFVDPVTTNGLRGARFVYDAIEAVQADDCKKEETALGKIQRSIGEALQSIFVRN